ncbi:MAG TPA: PIN domain-containing protein [Rhizomicrobium sp.]
MTRITLDTNILFYAYDARDPLKQQQALAIIEAAAVTDCALGLQTIGEFYVAIVRKLKVTPAFARDQVKSFLASFDTFGATANAHSIAAEEAAMGRFSYWDGVLLASAAQNGCTIFISEDMADGARLGTITVCRPFGTTGLNDAARKALGIA